MCSWDAIGEIWAIVSCLERRKHDLSYLGFLELLASKPGLQALSGKTDATNGFADPDLGGVALTLSLDFQYFAGSRNLVTGEDDRS